jgi:protein-arginine kinase activator protein McsA
MNKLPFEENVELLKETLEALQSALVDAISCEEFSAAQDLYEEIRYVKRQLKTIQ